MICPVHPASCYMSVQLSTSPSCRLGGCVASRLNTLQFLASFIFAVAGPGRLFFLVTNRHNRPTVDPTPQEPCANFLRSGRSHRLTQRSQRCHRSHLTPPQKANNLLRVPLMKRAILMALYGFDIVTTTRATSTYHPFAFFTNTKFITRRNNSFTTEAMCVSLALILICFKL